MSYAWLGESLCCMFGGLKRQSVDAASFDLDQKLLFEQNCLIGSVDLGARNRVGEVDVALIVTGNSTMQRAVLLGLCKRKEGAKVAGDLVQILRSIPSCIRIFGECAHTQTNTSMKYFAISLSVVIIKSEDVVQT